MLTAQRLYTRPYEVSDVDALASILGDPTTMQFWPQPFTKEQTQAWIERSIKSQAENGFARWPVFLKESNLLIGDAGYFKTEVNGQQEMDLGYIIHHPYWGNGYATEIAQALFDYGRNILHLTRVVANMAHNHAASARVAQKIGMQLQTTFINPKNRNIDTLLYVWQHN
jgi:RimJ/RimL family protein N-acetyltransferase